MTPDIEKRAMEIAKAIDDMTVDGACEVITTTITKVAEEARKEERERIEEQLRTLLTTDKRKYDVVLWEDIISILKDK